MSKNDSKALKAEDLTITPGNAETALTEAPEARTIEMRALQSQDIFKMVAVIKKIGFREFKGVFESAEVQQAIAKANSEDGAGVEAVGLSVVMQIAGIVIDHLNDAEQEIYALLGGLSGLSNKEMAELPALDFAEMVLGLFQKQEFKDFFKVAARLTK